MIESPALLRARRRPDPGRCRTGAAAAASLVCVPLVAPVRRAPGVAFGAPPSPCRWTGVAPLGRPPGGLAGRLTPPGLRTLAGRAAGWRTDGWGTVNGPGL